MAKRFKDWAREKPHELIIASITIFFSVIGTTAGVIQTRYAIADHTVQNKRSDLVGESHPVASINSANLSNLLPNKQIYTDYSIVHNTESSEQENYMTAYLKDVLGHDQYKGKIDGSITKIVFARPPYLNVQYGIGSCVIEASIRSGTRVLVFQNKFEGHATGKSQAEPNELQKLACYDAVNKMLQEISL